MPEAESPPGSPGHVILPMGHTLTAAERRIADKLVREGHTVEALVESTGLGERTADFLVDGARTELKTLSGLSSRDLSGAMARRILAGAGQGPHIIADVEQQAGMTIELAERAARRAYGADTERRIASIRVIGADFDITIPRQP